MPDNFTRSNLYRAFVVGALVIACSGLEYYLHIVYSVTLVYTHLFYIPVVLAAFWWGLKGGLLMGLFFGLMHAAFGLFGFDEMVFVRSLMLVFVGSVMGIICERRKRAEEMLRESEQRFRSLVETTSDWIWEVDENGVYTYASPKVKDLLGYDPEEVIGKTPFDFMPGGEAERVAGLFRDIVGSQKAFVRLENTNLYKDGRHVVLETSGVPMFDAKGDLVGYRGVDRDITERRRAEEALRESESKLSAMLQSIGDHISMMDKDLNILWANETAKKIFGEDIIGRKCYEVYHGRKQPCEPCLTLKVFQDGKVHEHDTQVIDKDGKIIYFHCTANVALRDEKRAPTAVIEISRDITERKRAEETVRREKQRAEQYLSIAGVMLATVDAEANITMINRRGCEILGYEEEELIGKNWFDLLVPQEIKVEVRGVFRELMAGDIEPVEYYENPLLTKDGEERTIAFHNTVIRDPDGQIVGVLFSGGDITERKKTEERIEAERKKLDDIMENMSDGLILFDMSGKVTFVNSGFENLTGYKRSELVGKDGAEVAKKVVKPKHLQRILKDFQAALKGEDIPETNISFTTKGGHEVPIGYRTSFIRDPKGEIAGIILACRDMTEIVSLHNELKKQALHDSLTGVYNRRYFTYIVEKEIERSRRYEHPFGFLMIDVDCFKEINDRFGHRVGDKVLQAVASLLQKQVRSVDIVVRYGGDEFLIFLPETNGEGEIDIIRRRILEALSHWNGAHELVDFPVTVSMGSVHWSPGSPESVKELLAEVDRRMYEDKRTKAANGRSRLGSPGLLWRGR